MSNVYNTCNMSRDVNICYPTKPVVIPPIPLLQQRKPHSSPPCHLGTGAILPSCLNKFSAESTAATPLICPALDSIMAPLPSHFTPGSTEHRISNHTAVAWVQSTMPSRESICSSDLTVNSSASTALTNPSLNSAVSMLAGGFSLDSTESPQSSDLKFDPPGSALTSDLILDTVFSSDSLLSQCPTTVYSMSTLPAADSPLSNVLTACSKMSIDLNVDSVMSNSSFSADSVLSSDLTGDYILSGDLSPCSIASMDLNPDHLQFSDLSQTCEFSIYPSLDTTLMAVAGQPFASPTIWCDLSTRPTTSPSGSGGLCSPASQIHQSVKLLASSKKNARVIQRRVKGDEDHVNEKGSAQLRLMISQVRRKKRRNQFSQPQKEKNLVKQNKMLIPAFSLEEEYIVQEVLQARVLIAERCCDVMIEKVPDDLNTYFIEAATGRKITWSERVYNESIDIFRKCLIEDGNLMLNSFRNSVNPQLLATLADLSIHSISTQMCGTFFHNGTNYIEQEKNCFTISRKFWGWVEERVPDIKTCTRKSVDDFDKYNSPWGKTKEIEKYCLDTYTLVGEAVGEDLKLNALSTLLLLLTPPQDHVLHKSRHLKRLRQQVSTLMYRYLGSLPGYDEPKAARKAYIFTGLMERMHRSGRLTFGCERNGAYEM